MVVGLILLFVLPHVASELLPNHALLFDAEGTAGGGGGKHRVQDSGSLPQFAVPFDPSLAIAGGVFTVEAWVAVQSPPAAGDPALLGNKDWRVGEHAGFVLAVEETRGALRYVGNVGDGVSRADVVSVEPVSVGEWQHVAMSFERGGLLSLFVNGLPSGNCSAEWVRGPLSPSPPLPSSFVVGQDGTGLYPPRITAAIDDVRLWLALRDSDDILLHKDGHLWGNEPGLAAYFEFREGSGHISRDSAHPTRFGRVLHGALWVEGPPWLGHTATPTPTVTLPPTPSLTATATAVETPTSTFDSTATPTVTETMHRTLSSSPTLTQTMSVSPSDTKSRSPRITSTPTPTLTVSVTPTVTHSGIYTETVTRSSTTTRTITSRLSYTVTLSDSLTPTITMRDTRTRTTSPTPTATDSLRPTSTVTRSTTRTETSTFISTETPSSSVTATQRVTGTGTRSSTTTPTQTRRWSSTLSNSLTITPSQTRGQTSTVTSSGTFTMTASRFGTPSVTASITPTASPTGGMTVTASESATRTVSYTPRMTETALPSATVTETPTDKSTRTPSPLHSPSVTPMLTPSATLEETVTRSVIPSVTPSGGERTETSSLAGTDTGTPAGTETRTPAETETKTGDVTATRSVMVTETVTARDNTRTVSSLVTETVTNDKMTVTASVLPTDTKTAGQTPTASSLETSTPSAGLFTETRTESAVATETDTVTATRPPPFPSPTGIVAPVPSRTPQPRSTSEVCTTHECGKHGCTDAYGTTCVCWDSDLHGHWTGTECNVCAAGYTGAQCDLPMNVLRFLFAEDTPEDSVLLEQVSLAAGIDEGSGSVRVWDQEGYGSPGEEFEVYVALVGEGDGGAQQVLQAVTPSGLCSTLLGLVSVNHLLTGESVVCWVSPSPWEEGMMGGIGESEEEDVWADLLGLWLSLIFCVVLVGTCVAVLIVCCLRRRGMKDGRVAPTYMSPELPGDSPMSTPPRSSARTGGMAFERVAVFSPSPLPTQPSAPTPRFVTNPGQGLFCQQSPEGEWFFSTEERAAATPLSALRKPPSSSPSATPTLGTPVRPPGWVGGFAKRAGYLSAERRWEGFTMSPGLPPTSSPPRCPVFVPAALETP